MLDCLIDVTEQARRGLIKRPIGRDDVLESMYAIFSQPGKSNIMLLGAAGVGKTAIVEGVAVDVLDGKLHEITKVYQLDGNALLSGTMYRGQYEERAKNLIRYLTLNKDSITFIDEIHTVLGLGRTFGEAAGDFSQLLKPPLSRGEILCIGATTPEEYAKYVAPDTAFCRRFYNVNIPELSDNDVLRLLRSMNVRDGLRDKVVFDDPTLCNIVNFAGRIVHRFNPDKSIDVYRYLRSSLKLSRMVSRDSGKLSLNGLASILAKQINLLEKGHVEDASQEACKLLGVSRDDIASINASCEDIELLCRGVF